MKADANVINGLSRPRARTSDLAVPEICHQLRRKVLAFLREETEDKKPTGVQTQIVISMGIIDEALRRYRPENLSLSYNGGKDCLVLLILILACLPAWTESWSSETPNSNGPSFESQQTSSTSTAAMPPLAPHSDSSISDAPSALMVDSANQSASLSKTLQAIYIVPPDPFPEVERFVAETAQEYQLDLARYSLPMRPALEVYLKERAPNVQAVFLGTRRTDPHGKSLGHFNPTDAGWPRFMRIHPVIDWHYAEIWAFLRHLEIPFCDLYNRGFTSLGGINDTWPNPALALDHLGTKFRPAYELLADEEERLGRDH